MDLVSDLVIALAYYSIAAMSIYFVWHRRDVPYSWMFGLEIFRKESQRQAGCLPHKNFWRCLLFGGLIICDGTTHIMDVWMLWHPIYWLSLSIKAITAIVSTWIAIELMSLLNKAPALPRSAQVETTNPQLEKKPLDRQGVEESNTELATALERLEQEIVSRREIEKFLWQSEACNQALLRAIPDLMFRVAKDGTYLDCPDTRSFEPLIPRSELRGKKVDEVLPPDVAQQAMHSIEQALSTSKLQIFEYRLAINDRQQDFEARIAVSGAEEVLVLVRDITDRKQTEAALRESEERFRKIFEEGPLGMAISNSNYRFLKVNAQFCQIVGYTQEELTALSYFDITYPDDLQKNIEVVQQLNSGKIAFFSVEKRYVKKDGQLVWVDLTVSLIRDRDGNFLHYLGMVQDITDRKLAEQALRQSEERFRTSVENMLDGFGIYTAVRNEQGEITDFVVEYVNAAACASNGITKEEQIGKLLCEMFPAHRTIGLFAEYCQVVETGKPLVKESLYYEDAFADRQYKGAFDIRVVKLSDGFAACWRDITERKQAELLLYSHEQQFKALVENAPDIITRFDRQLRHVYINPVIERAAGVSAKTFIGKTHKDLGMPPELVERWQQTLHWVFETGEETIDEFEYSTPSGSRWFQSRIVPELIVDGKVEFVLAIARDITLAKQTEAEIKASAQRLLTVIETVGEGITLSDRSGGFEIFNSKMEEITGYTQAEANCCGDFLAVLYPDPSDYQKAQANLAALTEQGEVRNLETTIQTKAATQKTLLVSTTLVQHQHQVLFLSVYRDITKRKQSEQALRESEERFRQLAENINQIFWMISPNTHELLYVSPAYEKIWGRTLESLYERPESWLEIVSSEDGERVESAVKNRMVAYPYLNEEFRIVRSDGEIRWIWARTFPIRNEEGEIYRIAGIAEDITERKRAETEIFYALAKEKELNELKSRFVSMTSHEFRTPLTTIQSAAELLEYYGHKWTEEERLEQLHFIQSAVKQMTNLLNDVLVIGRAEAGGLNFNPAPLDLTNFCRNLIAEMQLSYPPDRKILFVNNYPEFAKEKNTDLPLFDENLLRQILANLLSNAIKYSPQGSRIKFTLSCENGEAVFEIQDRGIGIPMEDRPRLFEFFYRASNAGSVAGTGLGLAIVKKCVDLHGGQIAVYSQQGVGTTFKVYLPIHI
ncbi:PAS domain S-box protein [Aerosakkonema funiforme]|uniref:PAS domain S-box protein n=3 Tax=Oscillatoriophycideae TaxID=1301283 RepID=UPI0016850116|nr:PAS domain S-box protein [Aerosakkonema funiforme]